MVYRRCPHCEGWLAASETVTSDSGSLICPIHEVEVHGFRESAPNGVLKRASYSPRKRYATAAQKYREDN